MQHSAERTRALEMIQTTFAETRASLDTLPISGWVLQYENGLGVRYDGPDKAANCGLSFATIWQERPTTWPDVRNGSGERAYLVPIDVAREIALDLQDQSIVTFIENMGDAE